MDLFNGVDWTPFVTYIENKYPGAMPYIRAIMFLIPVVGWVAFLLNKILPLPNTVHPPISDVDLQGHLSPRLYRWVHHLVGIYNEMLYLTNWFCKTRMYSKIYALIGLAAADAGKIHASQNTPPDTKIPLPPVYVPDEHPSDPPKSSK